MRQIKHIVYLLDGLSPLALKGRNNLNFFNTKIKSNFISKIKEKSLVFDNCYGHGETYSTTYSMLTGRDIYTTYCDAFHAITSFPKVKNLGHMYKKKRFKNIFFKNGSEKTPSKGYYKRYHDTIASYFDIKCIKKKHKKYTFQNFFEEHKIKNILKNEKKILFFIHDFSLHDNPQVYKNSTPKKYLKAIDKSAKIIQKNLKLMNYNKNIDTLYFLSDHGMTMAPNDQLHFNNQLTKKSYNLYYKNLLIDEKVKFNFFIKFPKSNKGIFIKKILTSKYIFFIIRHILLSNLNFCTNKFLKKINIMLPSKAITSVRSAFQSRYESWFEKNYFHTHFIFLSKKLKFTFSLKHKILFYDLNKSSNMNLKKIPKSFLKKINEYFSLKNYIKKYLILVYSIVFRIVFKILDIFNFVFVRNKKKI
jgi:hypothetical protein